MKNDGEWYRITNVVDKEMAFYWANWLKSRGTKAAICHVDSRLGDRGFAAYRTVAGMDPAIKQIISHRELDPFEELPPNASII